MWRSVPLIGAEDMDLCGGQRCDRQEWALLGLEQSARPAGLWLPQGAGLWNGKARIGILTQSPPDRPRGGKEQAL